ncbi:MAG: DUF1810 domain-containing protein [Actinobacteria bacterium]|nr:DUF1810 domain-containing protein [Actinomycetota bacterium]MCA1719801.1 DUF1810 domain-containing protein [Actinomycetota bacterium]
MENLERFVDAQRETYDGALAEIRAGRKTSHWMWFVFPQLAGLGRSSTAQHYAIRDLDEARAYLDHPVLGPRLREAAAAVPAGDPVHVFGDVDAMKLRSSLTLFGQLDPYFTTVLDRCFDGASDDATLRLLAGS